MDHDTHKTALSLSFLGPLVAILGHVASRFSPRYLRKRDKGNVARSAMYATEATDWIER